MAGRQRTFDLVPTSLVISNGPKPPMTSKAAKKAHQLANRGPKVSRAEQRRRDAEELAAQKREYERGKASAKAKAAREKKAAKEQTERHARKKLGIPEPSRFVHASQPTISKFVKHGSKRIWQNMESVAGESDIITVCDDAERTVAGIPGPPAKKVKTADESEDEFGEFPSFSQSDFRATLEKVDSSTLSEGSGNVYTKRGINKNPETLHRTKIKDAEETIAAKKISDEHWKDCLNDTAATQFLLEEAGAALRPSDQKKPSKGQNLPVIVPPILATTTQPVPSTSNLKITCISPRQITIARSALQERSVNARPPLAPTKKEQLISNNSNIKSLKPFASTKLALQERTAYISSPPVPIKEKKPLSFTLSPPKPRNLSPLPSLPILQPILPPSATQAFLEDHLDDFFPSPSQEIRELLDDIDSLPNNPQLPRKLESGTKALNEELVADLISTQDLNLSSQDILEITTSCPLVSKPQRARQPTSAPPPIPSKPKRQPSGRFFEEKDEDLLCAAIQESRMLAEQNGSKYRTSGRGIQASEMSPSQQGHRVQDREPSARMERTFQRTVSNATDYGEEDFDDCEEELLALF